MVVLGGWSFPAYDSMILSSFPVSVGDAASK